MEQLTKLNQAYRLYIGHGNWINLSVKTTCDLLDIFKSGVPTRYQLAPGLFIDIIPHNVDFNSRNIDIQGLMRADLVYESAEENAVQKIMTEFVRDSLNKQGITDLFPPIEHDEELPVVTSLPTHKHLSLVPFLASTVRRRPKSSQNYQLAFSPKDAIASNQSKKYPSAPYFKRPHKNVRVQKGGLPKKIAITANDHTVSTIHGENSIMHNNIIDSDKQCTLLHIPSSFSYISLIRPSEIIEFDCSPTIASIVSPSDTIRNTIASAHLMEVDSQPSSQRLSPIFILNNFDQDISIQKDSILSSRYPYFSASFKTTHHNHFLEQQKFLNKGEATNESLLPLSYWADICQNIIKDEEKNWISPIKSSKETTRNNILVHSELIAEAVSSLNQHGLNIDKENYNNDISNFVTTFSQPDAFNNVMLTESFKACNVLK